MLRQSTKCSISEISSQSDFWLAYKHIDVRACPARYIAVRRVYASDQRERLTLLSQRELLLATLAVRCVLVCVCLMCCAVLLLSVRVHRCLRNVFQPDGFWRIAYHTETYTHREPGHGFMHRQRRRPATLARHGKVSSDVRGTAVATVAAAMW